VTDDAHGGASSYLSAEARARVMIDRKLEASGWVVQNANRVNLGTARGVAVREFFLQPPHGRADYLLFVDRKPVGAIEAKPEGETLTEVELQTAKYVDGLPDGIGAPVLPLPFRYESTGSETRFTNARDSIPRSRRLFDGHFHRPEILAAWIEQVAAAPEARILRARIAAFGPAVLGFQDRLARLGRVSAEPTTRERFELPWVSWRLRAVQTVILMARQVFRFRPPTRWLSPPPGLSTGRPARARAGGDRDPVCRNAETVSRPRRCRRRRCWRSPCCGKWRPARPASRRSR
jgi:hypothetical protein